MRVARERLARHLERHRLAAGQHLGLRDVEGEYGAEGDAPLAGLLAVRVALLDAHRRQDAERFLAFPDDAIEAQPGLEARDTSGLEAERPRL